MSFFVSGGFLLLAGLISCLVDLLKRKRDRSFEIRTAMIIKVVILILLKVRLKQS